MPVSLVDSHCHLDRLDLTVLGGDLNQALAAAREQGVDHLLCVCIDLDNFPVVADLAHRYPQVYASAGVHPNERDTREPEVAELTALVAQTKVVAIGETGLDYFHGKGDLEWQRQRFRRHIRAARESAKPLIIHTRDAQEDTLRILTEERAAEVGGVMHCFTEDWSMAERALEMGFYISFSGIVTFSNARQLREVARKIPLGRMLIETDSPYLAPEPHRGSTNEPAYVRFVAERIAELKSASFASVAEETSKNFRLCFRVEA